LYRTFGFFGIAEKTLHGFSIYPEYSFPLLTEGVLSLLTNGKTVRETPETLLFMWILSKIALEKNDTIGYSYKKAIERACPFGNALDVVLLIRELAMVSFTRS
jgi:hypothetical protein